MTVYLWWIGTLEADGRMLDQIRLHAHRVFRRPVRVWRSTRRPEGTLDPRRGQHFSTAILRWLMAHRPPQAAKVLALTDVDLFIPVLTFVYGEAQLDGPVAVVSTSRLGDGNGPLMERSVFSARLIKEAVHELGHTFGLLHCPQPHCVMARSVSLAQVDAKSADLCRQCRMKLQELQELQAQSGVAHE
jgi:archaemetzincin